MPVLNGTHTRNAWSKLCLFLLSACMLINIFILFPPKILLAQTTGDDVTGLTQALVAQGLRYEHAAPAERAKFLTELFDVVFLRRQLLLAMIEENPAMALRTSLTGAARAGLPTEVNGFLEEKVEVEGELEILHEDRRAESRYLYFLKADDTRYPLHFYDGHPDHLLTGARIRVQGIRLETKLALGGGTKSVQTVVAAPVPNALGEQRTLLILVNFQDNTIEPYSVANAQNILFGTTSAFFLENSYQHAWLGGNVVGWFTIPVSSTVCDYESIATQAQSAAAAAGVNLAAYTHYLYAFPQNACGWWGLSGVGGNPSQSWVNGNFELGVTAHELGHGLGLWHSHSLDCGATAVVAPTCTSNEYGDIVDMMGASHWAHFNAFQKERLGWLNSAGSPTITTVQSDGVYAIEPYETAGVGPKALKILKSTDPATGQKTWYYVEARQPIGFDASLADTTNNVVDGVLVHRGVEGNGNTSSLLDMTPATPVYYWWYDPALTPEQTFNDPETGITIATISAGPSGGTVSVRFSSALGVAVSTDKTTYYRSQSALIRVTARQGGSPVVRASVRLRITRPDGVVIGYIGTTDQSGSVTFKHRIGRQDPAGSWRVDAVATKGTTTGNASMIFIVQ